MEEPPREAGAPAAAIKALVCPSCGGTIELRAAGYTVTFACVHCSSLLDVSNPDVRLIQRYEKKKRELEIPLGTRGTLKGVDWEAIGYLRRSENGTYPWEEYLLFNPYHGYRWLVTDGRGWTLGTMLTTTPRIEMGEMVVAAERYAPFFRHGSAQVDYVLGEFYWRVAAGEYVETADYVRPGWMLSFEGNETERNWTLGELLDPAEMVAAFCVQPPPEWYPGGPPPLAHQPSPFARTARVALKLALAGFAALFLIFLMFGGTNRRQSFEFAVDTASGASSATVGPVVFDRPYQAVTIRARAPMLENAWIDLDYALVNRKTQESFEAYAAAERYSGNDGGESWTEGDRGATTKLAMVPRGTYDLVVDANGQKWNFDGSGVVALTITVAQGASFWSNFFVALLLLLLPAVFLIRRHLRFEAARRAEGDD